MRNNDNHTASDGDYSIYAVGIPASDPEVK